MRHSTSHHSHKFAYLAIAFLLLGAAVSEAAYISFDEDGVDQIYSQDTFGDNPIDIRLGEAIELVNPDFLNINTPQRMWDLFSSHLGPWNTVNAFFVDNLTYCSGYGYWAGCGLYPGNAFIVDSFYAGTFYGAELLAHELGHNLGLGHISNSLHLMNPYLGNGTFLAPYEVSRILSSSLVQWDQLGWYIDITPVLVVAEASTVPEPATVLMLLTGMVATCLRRRTGERNGC